MRRTLLHGLLWIGVLMSAGSAWGQSLTLEESVISNAGGTVSAGTRTLTAAVGQSSPAGASQRGSFVLYSGYPSPFFGVEALVIEIPLSDPGVQPSGQAISVTADVVNRVADVEEVTLFYRTGGSSSFTSVAMAPKAVATEFEATIPGAAIGEEGIAYYITATDAEGNAARVPKQGVLSFPVQLEDPGLVKDSPQPGGSTQSAYRLISVPIDLNSKDPTAVLGDDISFLQSASTYDPSEARFFEPIGQTVSEFPRTNDMRAGKAFWLIVRDGADNIDTGAGTIFALSRPFEIQLDDGWNFIGNPFNFPISVDNLRMEDGQDVVLRSYGSGGYNPVSSPVTVMEPFEGYAVFSEQETTLFVDPGTTAQSEAAPSKALAAQAAFDPSWAIRITGRVGAARDADNVAAVMRGAQMGRDAIDWPEPPPISPRITVSFPHPEWGSASTHFSSDVRPEPLHGETWTFEVTTDASRGAELLFGGLEGVPAGWEVWLLDEKLKIARDVRDEARYQLEASTPGEPRSFQLVVGRRDYIEAQLESADALPLTYKLDGVFPNPTRGRTTIRFGLPQEEQVTIDIYNVLGQRVATLLQKETKEAGFHVVRWGGRAGAGAPLASGVYFVRLRAGDFVASRKIVRVR